MKLLITDTNDRMIQHNSILTHIDERGSRYPVIFKNGSFGMEGSYDFIPLSDWNLALFKIVRSEKTDIENIFKNKKFQIETDMNGQPIYNNSKLILMDKKEMKKCPKEEDRTFNISFENGSFGMNGNYNFIPLCKWNLSQFKVA